ncbi:helix-turn-helix domain-containing protein [Bradyrhizobium pachyrhizi]|uniref:helix-turn-helix domain-containing protein n=1 Tax=Bradyrhizobium pachyrhizi TaxID=280333 RepID=UPI0024B04DCD|nr:helix-turn-helix domain-containing protein [Bradyrhizobium pachyrhizi]WFU53318.1 helix-turn-helix domain-containing protein [Bradyrhizobium pachyrhizi]
MGRAVPSTHFSTRDLPVIDGFDAWRDKISVIFDVDRIGGGPRPTSFQASVDAYQIGNLVITVSTQGQQAYSLLPKRARSGSMDLIQVGLYRSGGYRGNAGGISIEGNSGDIQVLDLGRPMRSVEPDSDMVCVFLPREILQERIGDLDGLHGMDLRSGTGRLLADYLGLLAQRLPQMSADDGEPAANATVEMIAACLRPTIAKLREAQSSVQDVILLRAKRVIEEKLLSARLTPELLCGMLGMSRRSLYRLFEPLGGVHHYIVRRRLSHIRRELSDQGNHERIADLAARFGFTCQETFWRAFKREYGVPPGEVRSSLFPDRKHRVADPDAGFDQWLKQLRI